jgi:hypothetical protein
MLCEVKKKICICLTSGLTSIIDIVFHDLQMFFTSRIMETVFFFLSKEFQSCSMIPDLFRMFADFKSFIFF